MYKKIGYYAQEISNLLSGKTQYPVTCEVDISNACQNDCDYCFYKDIINKEPLFLDYWKYQQCLGQMKACGVKSISFTGAGEPTLNPRFFNMVDDAYHYGFQIGLVTNGINGDTYIPIQEIFTFIRISINVNSKFIDKQIENLKKLVDNRKGETTIGISSVVSTEDEIVGVERRIGGIAVDYKQFKPDCRKLESPALPRDNGHFIVSRYKTENNLPCTIAALVGSIYANGKVYFCCQKRGIEEYCLGDLDKQSFSELWENRKNIKPDYENCVGCKYTNYAKEYTELPELDKTFLKHRNFL